MPFEGTSMPNSDATSSDAPLFYRVAQVAAQLNVHRTTVYRAIDSGALRAVRFGQGRGGLRIPAAALADYLSAAGVRSLDLEVAA